MLHQHIWLTISNNWAETKVDCISWTDGHKTDENSCVFVSEICHSKRDVVVVIDSSGSIRDNNPEDQSIDNWIILKGEGEGVGEVRWERERERERERETEREREREREREDQAIDNWIILKGEGEDVGEREGGERRRVGMEEQSIDNWIILKGEGERDRERESEWESKRDRERESEREWETSTDRQAERERDKIYKERGQMRDWSEKEREMGVRWGD